MNPKTYQAQTMAEALAEVKKDLGRDAVILQTRTFRKGRLLGLLGGKPMWEVTATPNLNVPHRVETSHRVAAEDAESRQRRKALSRGAANGAAAAATRRPDTSQEALCRQVTKIRNMVETLLSRRGSAPAPDVLPELQAFHGGLLRRDVEEATAADLMQQLQAQLTGDEFGNKRLVRDKLIALIEARIPIAPLSLERPADDRPKVIALIGPTGVGKTTTIAKLAANFKLREKKRVGLVTVDTYRIAAVDQLRTYAEIIEVRLRAVWAAGELHQALQAMSDADVILIDTAGRSQNDQLRLTELRGFLAAARADEVHLLVSAVANRSCAQSTLDRFLPLGANRIIISKVDEAETFGVVLDVARAKVGLSYVTTGQDVPDDIAPAEAGRLATWIVGEGGYEN